MTILVSYFISRVDFIIRVVPFLHITIAHAVVDLVLALFTLCMLCNYD